MLCNTCKLSHDESARCLNRSATCAKMRRYEDALADAESAVKCDEKFVKGYLRRAAANEALKDWDAAVRDYEKVHCPSDHQASPCCM